MRLMWTTDRLREVMAARAEMAPASPVVGRALLFFERWKGRTEENYSRAEAKRELDATLDHLEPDAFPAERQGEFNGLRELRVYAQDYVKQREAKYSLSKAIGKVAAVVAPKKDKVRDRER
jgi:hypothetical protein